MAQISHPTAHHMLDYVNISLYKKILKLENRRSDRLQVFSLTTRRLLVFVCFPFKFLYPSLMMIYGWLGELIKSLNRTPGSITTAITSLWPSHGNPYFPVCLSGV